MKNTKWIAVVLFALTVAACGTMPSSSSSMQQTDELHLYHGGP